MNNKSKELTNEMCSHVWVTPIKSTHEGIQKIGIEMEMFAYDAHTFAPIGTENSSINPQMIMERISNLVPNSKSKRDNSSNLITLVELPNKGNFSLEPGGQIEYSSSPNANLSELAKETADGLQLLQTAGQGDVVFLSHGTNPITNPNHPLILPKERYKIMTRYFESAPKNVRGIDMMRHCATVQANIDVFGDVNWKSAVHLTTVLVPLTQYLFANSNYFQGSKSNSISERQTVWNNMDPSRSGFPFTNQKDYFEQCPEWAYANWAKKAAVFLVESLPIEMQPLFQELTFAQWMENGYKGTKPTISDWETHLATLFPHLRLRKFLEIRHIDAQPFEHTFAPIAFFSALIQCNKTRNKTWELIQSFQLNYDKLFDKSECTYQELHKPLLNLACEILSDCKEKEGVNSIQAFSNKLDHDKSKLSNLTALEFVKSQSTRNPSQLFMQNLI